MAKNIDRRIYSKDLADIALNKTTRLNAEVYAMCGEDDQTAARLRTELKSVLIDLLKGNVEPVNQKLTNHARRASAIAVRSSTAGKQSAAGRALYEKKQILIGDRGVFLEITPREVEPEEIIYGFVLRRSLETGDIQRLALCQICGELFYRKSLKGKFCGKNCRWEFFNSYDARQDRYKRFRKKHGLKGKVIPRGPRKKQERKA